MCNTRGVVAHSGDPELAVRLSSLGLLPSHGRYIEQLFYAGYFGLATGATHFVAINTHSSLILKYAQLYN